MPGGFIRFYPATNNFIAECRQEEHNAYGLHCQIKRSNGRGSVNKAQGRPLGFSFAWLGAHSPRPFSHGVAKWPHAVRLTAREYFKTHFPEAYASLACKERQEMWPGEGDEPLGDP